MAPISVDVGEGTDIGHEPSELHDVRSVIDLTSLRLMQLHQLRAGHPTSFNEELMLAEAKDPKLVQVLAVGMIPNFRYLMTDKGPKSASKIVGWARSRIEQIGPKKNIATLESIHIDQTVQRAAVQEYLLQRLKKVVSKPRRKLMGLRVLVPPSDKELTQYYYKRGFFDFDFPDTDEALLWRPQS